MSQTIVLISGANRGLGRGLAERFFAQPNHKTVIAAIRNAAHPTSESLIDSPIGEGSTLRLSKYDAAAEQDSRKIVTQLQEEHGDVQREDVLEHMVVNVFGMLALFQDTRDLLQKSAREPIFVPMSSGAGSMSWQPDIPCACYSPTKAMVNSYTVIINAEEEWLNSFPLHPGLATTDMGSGLAKYFGLSDEMLITPEVAVDGIFQVLLSTTKEKHGGKFVSYTGEILDW